MVITCNRYSFGLGRVLLTVQIRWIITETHETASVHLPCDSICPLGIKHDFLVGLFTCVLHVSCWIFLICSYSLEQSCLIIKLLMHFFQRGIELPDFTMQAISFTHNLLHRNVFYSNKLFLVKQLRADRIQFTLAFVYLAHVVAGLEFVFLG
jgi:hypothetical protein